MAGVERGRVNSFDWGSEVSLVSNYREPWVGLLVFLLHTSTSIKNVRMLVFLCFFFCNLHFSFSLAGHQYKLRCVSWNRY